MTDFRERVNNGKSSDEKFEAIVDILADMASDLKEMKGTMSVMQQDLDSWKEVRDGFLFSKKLLTGTTFVIVGIASLGGAILTIANFFNHGKQ